MTNPAWYWLFNYKNQCWDKAETDLQGWITVYQWDKQLKKYTTKRIFKSVDYSFFDINPANENDYAYWYATKSKYQSDPRKTEYENPNKEKDSSRLGQVWKWSGSNWVRVSETGTGKIDPTQETYIIVHGLRNSYKESWVSDMARALESKGQVLCIDWGDAALHDDFLIVSGVSGDFNASNIDDAAASAVLLLSQVMHTSGEQSNGKFSLDGFESKITMVGHSFGAHLSAYFSKYLTGTIKCIQGLDSAEENTQANPIILGPDAAPDVFFYKSSDCLGGGDTWNDGDRLLGKYNFYLAPRIFGLNAEDGLSTGFLSTGLLDTAEHGYPCTFFTNYIEQSDIDEKLYTKILDDIEDVGVKWHGIVNGSNFQIDCVNMGYYLAENSLTSDSGWSYSDYNQTVNRVVGKMNTTFASVREEIDMPAEIYAVACMTALDVQDLKVNGTALSETLDKNAPASAKIQTNKQFTISFKVKNHADNISFVEQDVKNAQLMQKMTHEIWLSPSDSLNVYNHADTLCLYSSLYDSGNEELYTIGALGLDSVQAAVAVDHVTLFNWIESNSELKTQFEKTGAVDVYVHVRAGVDGTNSASFIPGELQTKDNTVVQKISLKLDLGNWKWCYNYVTKCWDKVTQLEDGSYIAYQWNASGQNWTNVKYLKPERYGSGLQVFYSDDEFGYYYAERIESKGASVAPTHTYINQDRNDDSSMPGQIWVWQNGKWEQITEQCFREETYGNTYIITHGLRNTLRDKSTEWVDDIASALAAREKDARILAIDWGDKAKELNAGIGDVFATGIADGSYRSATMLAQLIGNYTTSGQVNISTLGDVHLIGHSYGAHYSAYLSDKMIGQTVKNLYALDAAQTKLQVHDIKLNASSADDVYAYKTSSNLGGELVFGDFNFYTVSEDGQLSGWTLRLSDDEYLADTDAHSYATSFFADSIISGIYSGYYFDEHEYYDDFLPYRNTWQGIVNGAHDGRIECVTIGYEKDENGWTVAEYMSVLQNCHSGLDVLKYKMYEKWYKNKFTSLLSGLYSDPLPPNIYFNQYLVDYAVDSEKVTINGDTAGTRGVEIEYGEDITVAIPVKNWADNTSFDTESILDAQEGQGSTCNIWISPYSSAEGGYMCLYDSVDLSDVNPGKKYHKELLIAPGKETIYNCGLVLEESDVVNILTTCEAWEQLDNYNKTGKAELYVYAQVGAKEGTTSFIKGELNSADNWSTGQKILLAKEKTGIQTIFVIDVSGSMGEEIARVRSGLLNYINDLRDKYGTDYVPTMQLITFKQPSSTGNESAYVDVVCTTNSLTEMASAVNKLRASGGYYSYENSNHALEKAVRNIAQGGNIILATDEPAAPGVNVNRLIKTANRKDVTVHSIISGNLTSHSSSVPVASVTSDSGSMVMRSSTMMMSAGAGTTETNEDQNSDDDVQNAKSITVGQDVLGEVHYGNDRCDWYKINLTKHYEYTTRLQSDDYNAYFSLYDTDGTTLIKTIKAGETFTFSPDASGMYYIRCRAEMYDNTPYSFSMEQTAKPNSMGEDLESYSTISTETGGSYLVLPDVNSGNGTAYESAIYNFLMSQHAPVVMACGPNAVSRGTTVTLSVSGSGTNWRAGETVVSFSSDKIVTQSVEVVSATRLLVTVSIAADCTVDAYDVTVTSGSEVARGVDVLTVSKQPTSAKIVSVSCSNFECGETFIATIHGYATNWSQENTNLSLGPGVTITDYTVVSATEIRVNGLVAENAELGYRTVQVKTNSTTLKLTHALFVSSAAPDVPAITLVTPDEITMGRETVLTMKGSNVDFTTAKISVNLGYGVEIRDINVIDAETIEVTVYANDTSTVGFRDVRVTVNDQLAVLLNGLDVAQFNDVPDKAISLPFSSDDKVYRVDSVGALDTVDYFKVNTATGGSYSIGVESDELTAQVRLSVGVMEDGDYVVNRSIIVNNASAIEEISGVAFEAGKDYYICVEVASAGDALDTQYTLNVENCGDKVVTDDNTSSTANVLAWEPLTGAANRGWVGFGDAVDFYNFELTSNADVRLSVSELTAAMRVTLYKENEAGGLTQVSTNSVRSSGLDRTLSLTAGTYFVEMASYDGGAGRYNSTYALELEKEEEDGTTQFAVAQV